MPDVAKCTNRKPCAECPFRKTSMRGWLGPDKPQDVLFKVHTGEMYYCHMDVAVKVEQAELSGVELDPDTVEHCVGALMHANKSCKRFRNPTLAAAQDRLESQDHSQILDVREFSQHHDLSLGKVVAKLPPKRTRKPPKRRKTR